MKGSGEIRFLFFVDKFCDPPLPIIIVRQKVGTKVPTFCRDDPTRTDDPYVPNVVRYQLRYIPIAIPATAQKAASGDCLSIFLYASLLM